MEKSVCFTIGHSNHTVEKFVQLLETRQIDCVADVRSAPYSKYVPQFNSGNIKKSLKDKNIEYIFMGGELGARQTDPRNMTDGKVDFNKVAASENFLKGIARVMNGIGKGFKIALMCAEKDPMDCHRFMLVSRALSLKGVEIKHILDDGSVVPNKTLEEALIKDEQADLFSGINGVKEDPLEAGYKKLADAVSDRVFKIGKNRSIIE